MNKSIIQLNKDSSSYIKDAQLRIPKNKGILADLRRRRARIQ